jgi:hypothetical protein
MNLEVEYLGEIEVIFEMALGNDSGNQVGSIHEKNQRSKISWDYPFKLSLAEAGINFSWVVINLYISDFNLHQTFAMDLGLGGGGGVEPVLLLRFYIQLLQ